MVTLRNHSTAVLQGRREARRAGEATAAIEITNTLDEKIWRLYVDHHPQGSVFQTPEMFHVMSGAKGHHPTLWAAIKDGDAVQALFVPVQLTLYGGPLRPLTTRAVAYGAALCNPDPEGERALRTMLSAYARAAGRQALFTEMRNLSDLTSLQPVLQECGYQYEDHLDYLIDLSGSPDEVMARIGSRTRKHIRQGLRRGDVQVKQVVDRQEISICYDLLQKTYASAGVPLADQTLFESTFEVLQPRGMCRFSLAFVKGEPVATSVELLYKDVMYGWYGGLDRKYADYMPGEMLMWDILKWGSENGYRVYDFGGAGKPGETYRVRDFKAKFGGQLVCFGRNTCVHSPLLYALSTHGYDLYRRLRRDQSGHAAPTEQETSSPSTGN